MSDLAGRFKSNEPRKETGLNKLSKGQRFWFFWVVLSSVIALFSIISFISFRTITHNGTRYVLTEQSGNLVVFESNDNNEIIATRGTDFRTRNDITITYEDRTIRGVARRIPLRPPIGFMTLTDLNSAEARIIIFSNENEAIIRWTGHRTSDQGPSDIHDLNLSSQNQAEWHLYRQINISGRFFEYGVGTKFIGTAILAMVGITISLASIMYAYELMEFQIALKWHVKNAEPSEFGLAMTVISGWVLLGVTFILSLVVFL